MLHLFEVVPLAVSDTRWAISFVTIEAHVCVFCNVDHLFAVTALESLVFCVLGHHGVRIVITLAIVFLNALLVFAKSKAFFLSLVENKLVSKVIDDIVAH